MLRQVFFRISLCADRGPTVHKPWPITSLPWRFAIALLLLFGVAGLNAKPVVGAQPDPTIIQEVPYGDAPKGDRRRSFDLYLPEKSAGKPPLLIFVHGGYWLISDDDYRIGPSLAANLVRDGVAVALVRYRLAPSHRHPAQANDVAAAIADLIRQSDKYGFDAKRVFLAGHSAGGHLASLIALDGRYLEKNGVSPKALAGVISISGLYNLLPTWDVADNQKYATEKTFGHDPAALKRASPLSYVRADAPPFLILNAFHDFPGFPIDARKFADGLRRAGANNVQQLMFKGADHLTILKLDDENNAVRRLMLGFMDVKPLPEQLAQSAAAEKRWNHPPYSTLPFWQHEKLVRSYPIDERFMQMLFFIYRNRKEELLEWPLKQFHAIDLFPFLDTLPRAQVGAGDFIILTNVSGERQVWRRQRIEKYRPVIVVGVDDEKDLFRFSSFYRMRREYSWKPGPAPPALAMPLGGFIYFLDAPPRELLAQSWHFGLTEDSFRRSKEDPLKAIRDLPKGVEEALTFRNGCVYCHSFRGVGSRSHHVHALTGKPQGGFALPLESYPNEVWRAFMFNQVEVAKRMGATPNIVSDAARQALFDLVNQSRGERGDHSRR
jgi:acetyl esterase/lipase